MPPRRGRRPAPTAPAKRQLPTVTFEELKDFNESINGCIYGDSGVGKTPFAAGAENAVILSTEKGSISAKRFGSKAELVRAPTWDHVVAALDLIEKRQAGKDRLDWMILDSVTKMQVLMIRWILERIVEEKEDRDLDIPAIADHQKWQNMFKRFVDRIVDMDINVIFIATAMHKEDEEGDDLVLPNIQGKDYAIAQYLCAEMDFVYVLKAVTDKKTDEPFWRLLTKARPPYFAKDRYDALPAVVNRPTMPEVIAAIQDSGEYNAALADNAKKRAKVAVTEDESEDPWATEDDEEEIEPPAKTRTRAKAAKGRRSQPSAAPKAVEPEEEDDELDEDLKTSRRAKVTKATAKKPVRRAKAKVEPEEDDDFDPDDEDDLDFEDDE
jgi:hypothetical protein